VEKESHCRHRSHLDENRCLTPVLAL